MNRRAFLAGMSALVTPAAIAGLAAPASAHRGRRGRRDDRREPVRRWGKDYFPNFTLRTQDDRPVRFYDDLLEGKIVTINFIFTDCTDICPSATANLRRVQQLLGERVGRDIFMYSISLTPERDDPRTLKTYADRFGVKPGWLFLTGKPGEIETLRRTLGYVDPDPVIDRDKTQHIGLLRYGNEPLESWGGCPVQSNPERIVEQVLWMDVPAAGQARKG